MSQYDLNPLDDEEERKRREAIAERMDQEAYANPVGPVSPSFGNIIGQAFDKRLGEVKDRFNQVGQLFSNPQAALQARAGLQAEQTAAEQATPVTQTIKTNPVTGEQKMTITGNVQDLSAANPRTPTVTGPAVPTVEREVAERQAMPQPQMAQPQPQMAQPRPTVTTPIAGMPPQLPAQGPIPAQAAQARPQMPQLPQPGPGVQVAGATQMPTQAAAPVAAAPGASLAQAGAQAQTTESPWIKAANEAGNDFYKLLDVANKHPESRDLVAEKIKQSFKQQTLKDEADNLMKAAQAGDLKAQNKMMSMIKPETGKPKEEVTVADYVKAIWFNRLGLTALSQDIQNKIIGKDTKFGQVTIGGTNWQVETDPSGQIIRARDDEGNFATESTLNKLRAGSAKFGTHTTSFTGGIHTVPNAEGTGVDLVMPTQNAITGQAGFTYASGPKQGQQYTGTATPQPQSIGTSFQKALDKALVDFKTSPSIAGAKAAMDKAYVLDPGDGSLIRATQAQINANSPDIFNQVRNYSPSGNVAEQLPAGTADSRQVAEAQRNIESIQRELNQPKPAGFSQKSEDHRRQILQDELKKNQAIVGRATPAVTAPAAQGGSLAQKESNIRVGEEVSKARQKPPAEALGKGEAQDIVNQRSADENYALIKPINDLIKQSTGSGIGASVDKLAGLFGIGTQGAQAIAKLNTMSYPFKYMIPRFEGPQSDKDTALYVEAAGDFANPKKPQAERLAALQGMIFMLKKYDKAGKNDWTFGETQGKAEPGTTSSGNKYKKVQ